MYYVYILLCNDKRTYVGCTSDLKNRFARHEKGYVQATVARRPLELVFYAAFSAKHKAYEYEKYLKSGSGRRFMSRYVFATL